MMGKCHFAAGESMFLGCSGLAMCVNHMSGQQSLWFHWFPASVTYGMLAVAGVAIGSLLPDIDSSSSVFGRFFHLPFKHRTWTHSFWAVAILCILIAYSPWMWLSIVLKGLLFGYLTHLLLDAVSAAGVCFWYPFQKYRMYPGGAFVKPGHKIKLYHAGSKMEIVLCGLICLVGFGMFVWAVFGHGGFDMIQWF